MMIEKFHSMNICRTGRPYFVYDGFPYRMPEVSMLPLPHWYSCREYLLREECAWVTADGHAIIGMPGDRINGASTPWPVRRVFARSLRPDGSLWLPSLFHDLGYGGREVCVYDDLGAYSHSEEHGRHWFDTQFSDGCKASPDPVPGIVRVTATAMLRLFGGPAWARIRRGET